MIGSNLVTKQTDSRGKRCDEVMVCKRLFTRREYYFSITLDRNTNVRLPVYFVDGHVVGPHRYWIFTWRSQH